MATHTLLTIPQQQRGPFDGFTTAAFSIPAGITQATIQTNIALSDLQNPANSLEIHMECSTDGFVNDIRFQAGMTWQGSSTPNPKTGTWVSPSVTFDGLDQMSGEQCRIEMTMPNAMDIGATVTAN